MKKKLLYLLLLFSGMASAQIVNIPDTNFKSKLLSATTTNNVAQDINGNSIVIDINGDYEIQESEALLAYELRINSSNISDLTGIDYFLNLQELICDNNDLTDLNVTSLTNLNLLSCRSNDITTLNVMGLINLEDLDCYFNELSVLDVSTLPNLVNLNCNANSISILDVSSNTNLEDLNCANNNLTTLDLNNNINLTFLTCFANQLETIFLKNGQDEGFDGANWGENPALEYICADDFQVENLMAVLGGGVAVSSYCSFTPGGEYNTITGTAIFDSAGDGCGPEDLPYSFVKLNINDGTEQGITFTNTSGEYSFYTGAGNFTVTPQFEDDWFTVSPAVVDFPMEDGSVSVQNFCIEPNGVHNDVEVIMVPLNAASPGFDAEYKIVYRNKGNQVSSGTVICSWDYQVLNPVNITPVPDDTDLGTYTWNYTNLQPFENREILMTLNVNAPTDVPPVNIGDILPFTALVEGEADETPDDNNYLLNQEVTGSYDPNNIICLQGETAPPEVIGDYLHYVVNFENTGTAAASFIVVKHIINEEDFDVSSLQVLNSSHNVTARVTGNLVEFIFDNINLAALDHGNILFKLKSKENLEPGDNVMNQANIYFDYNYPVETNEANTVFQTLNRGEFTIDNSVTAYPNPAKDIVTIKGASNLQSVNLYDIQGRLLQTILINDTEAKLDISLRAKGIYFLKIATDKGVKVEKIIKE